MNDDLIRDFYDNMKLDVSDEKVSEIKENVLDTVYSNKKIVKKRRLKFSTILAAIISVICLSATVSGVMQIPSVQSRVFNNDKNSITHSVKFSSSPVYVSDEVLGDLKKYIGTEEERKEKTVDQYSKHFESYEDVEDYFGLKILNNSMFKTPDKETISQDILVTPYEGISENISKASIYSSHSIKDNFSIHYGVGIPFTEEGIWEMGISFNNDAMTEKTSPQIIQYYSDKNTISCEIITYTEEMRLPSMEAQKRHHLYAYFTYENLEYSIDAYIFDTNYSMKECIEIYKTIIDNFQIYNQ